MSARATRPPKRGELWSGMPSARFERLATWTRATADRLNLRDWTFEIMRIPLTDETDDDGCTPAARTEPVFGRRHVRFRLCDDFASLSAHKQRHYLVHELMHLHLQQIQQYLWNALPPGLGVAGWTVLEPALRQQIEFVVDALTDTMAKEFPLP